MFISIYGERMHGTRSIANGGSIEYVIAFEVISELHLTRTIQFSSL